MIKKFNINKAVIRKNQIVRLEMKNDCTGIYFVVNVGICSILRIDKFIDSNKKISPREMMLPHSSLTFSVGDTFCNFQLNSCNEKQPKISNFNSLTCYRHFTTGYPLSLSFKRTVK